MPWSGSSPNQTFGRTDGTRSGATTWQEADGAGVDIIAVDHDTHDQDLAAGINAALKKDGGNSPSANLPMGGYKHTNVGVATALTQYLSATQAFQSVGRHVTTVGGTANAVTLTTGFSLAAYTEGMTFTWKVTSAITGPLTVNVDGLGAKSVLTLDGSELQTGEIRADFIPIICYDGTRFRWLNKPTSGSSGDVLARITPVGIVAPWPGATAPSGWLFAYGQAVSRTGYAELFAAYGTTYGTGDGSTTFNLPDYRGRTPFGDDNMGGSAASRITSAGSGVDGATLGAVGGAETHTLTVAQMPAHPHTGTTDASVVVYTDSIRSGVQGAASGSSFDANIGETTASRSSSSQTHTFTTNNAGGGLAHNNMPPAIIQNWIILALPTLASASSTGVNGFLYQFSSSTSGAPGDGKIGFDNATLSSATGFRISETDATGAPMGTTIATWDDSTSTIKGTLYVYKVGALSTYVVVQVTGTMTDSGGFDSFTHTYVSSNGTFAEGDQLSVIFVPKGDKGDTGVGIDWMGAWLTATAYALADGVSNGGSSYIATSAHTSGPGTEPGVGASWATVWDVIAAKGASGSGSGDMIAANNLSDVVSAATAFSNIKQAASDTATGVVELATNAEAVTGTDTARAVTPAGLAAHVDAAALTFKTIAVSGQSDVVADSRTDTLTLVAGTNVTITTNAGTDAITIASSASGGGVGDNLLANGGFRVNQRVASTGVADDAYCFDRWYALTQTSTITVGQQTNLEDGTPYAIRLTQAQASAQRMGLAQIIENADCIGMRGQAVTLSARVRMSATTTLRYAIIEWTGTADTVTSDWVNDWTSATFTAGNFFTSTTTTITGTGSTALTANTLATISLTATVGSSANNIAVMFWTDSTQAQNVTLDIGKAKLERGSSATTFEYAPIAQELVRCIRRYRKSYAQATAPGTATTAGQQSIRCGATSANVVWGVTWEEMAGTPTLVSYNPNSGASGEFYDASAAAARTVSGTLGLGSKGISGLTASVSITSGNLCDFHYTAVSEL